MFATVSNFRRVGNLLIGFSRESLGFFERKSKSVIHSFFWAHPTVALLLWATWENRSCCSFVQSYLSDSLTVAIWKRLNERRATGAICAVASKMGKTHRNRSKKHMKKTFFLKKFWSNHSLSLFNLGDLEQNPTMNLRQFCTAFLQVSQLFACQTSSKAF